MKLLRVLLVVAALIPIIPGPQTPPDPVPLPPPQNPSVGTSVSPGPTLPV